jgi:serine protease AprX
MSMCGRRPTPAIAAGPGVRVSGWEFDVRPNPLAAGGALHYVVPYPVAVTARLYDALGRRVHTLLSGRIVSGRGAIRFDTKDVARGVSLLRIEAGGLVRSFKVVIE